MFIQLNEATNHTVQISNHGELSTFIALSEALKGGFIIIYVYIIYIYLSLCQNDKPDSLCCGNLVQPFKLAIITAALVKIRHFEF